MIDPFGDEQVRTLINLQQRYDGWMETERALAALPYDLRRKDVGKYSYLYEATDRKGNGTSIAPWNDDAERRVDEYRATRAALRDRSTAGRATVEESTRLYRALKLPVIASEAGAILREADRRRLLGNRLLVVGTNAMPAYALEAMGRFRGVPEETEDFDLAWSSSEPSDAPDSVMAMLKAVDPTYTMNTEREFQALNRALFEVELLVAPSRAATMGRQDQPRPIPLPEQEWLLLGKPVDQVVACRDGSPARVVAPDPRWFALQKLWMSAQDKRNPNKRPKDLAQGNAVLDAVRDEMPRYPLDADFEASVPAKLVPFYTEWKSRPYEPPVRRWR